MNSDPNPLVGVANAHRFKMAARETSPKEASSSPAIAIVSVKIRFICAVYHYTASVPVRSALERVGKVLLPSLRFVTVFSQDCVFEGCHVPVRMSSGVDTCPVDDWSK